MIQSWLVIKPERRIKKAKVCMTFRSNHHVGHGKHSLLDINDVYVSGQFDCTE